MTTSTPTPASAVDPVTGLGTRDALFADLARAVLPAADASVLAIFFLRGFKEHQRLHGTKEAENLLMHVSAAFRCAVGEAGRCYRPREDELVALVDGAHNAAHPILDAAEATLRDAGADFLVTTSFGSSELPGEADEAIAALALADLRLQGISGRGPRERRRSPRSDGNRYPNR